MGEEWGTTTPFPFFCDFGSELADAVRNGRRAEFARFPEFMDPAKRERIPDPLSDSTFASAKLAWGELQHLPHSEWLAWYRRVIAVRHTDLVARFPNIRAGGRYRVIGDASVVVQWEFADTNEQLVLAANLSSATVTGFPAATDRIVWQEGHCGNDGSFGPFAVRWCIEPGARL